MTKTLRKDIPLLDVTEDDFISIKSVAIFNANDEQVGLEYAYDEGSRVVREVFEGKVLNIVAINPGVSAGFRIDLETLKHGKIRLEVSRYNRDVALLSTVNA